MSAGPFAEPWPATHVEEIDSTNEEARRRAALGDFGPAWIRADRQTAGRGRLGRAWDSPTGNLSATALIEITVSLEDAARICFAAGLAVIDAAEACGAPANSLRLKWPNDVLVGEAKLAGILIETGVQHGRTYMAAGFGVNVKTAPDVPGRATARLFDLPGGETITPATLLDALDGAFRARLNSLFQFGFAPTRTAWLQRAAFLGREVETSPASGRISGVMRDLDTEGALVIELADGALYRVRAGEVSLTA